MTPGVNFDDTAPCSLLHIFQSFQSMLMYLGSLFSYVGVLRIVGVRGLPVLTMTLKQ